MTGYYWPSLLFGSVVSTIGAALLYTLNIGTPEGKWIGYQILLGTGAGLTIQIPIIVNQASVSVDNLATITAITLCTSLSLLPGKPQSPTRLILF